MDILSAHEIGEGLPVLIIHGWQMRRQVEEVDFEPIFSKAPGLRRVYVDLPGMGTTPANNVKNLDDIYFRLAQFIDARFGSSRFLLVGSSCGGYLARALAQKYAEQVDGLLLRVPLIEPSGQPTRSRCLPTVGGQRATHGGYARRRQDHCWEIFSSKRRLMWKP